MNKQQLIQQRCMRDFKVPKFPLLFKVITRLIFQKHDFFKNLVVEVPKRNNWQEDGGDRTSRWTSHNIDLCCLQSKKADLSQLFVLLLDGLHQAGTSA